MTFDPTKPVQTRDGRKARIICTDLKNPGGETIVALVYAHDNFEAPILFHSNGRYHINRENPRDLINAPETKSWWSNAYPEGPGMPRASRELAAQEGRAFERVGIIELRMCDGKLVEAIQHDIESK